MKFALLTLLRFYKRWLSPALHRTGVSQCKYLPTCSEYAQIAIERHGAMRGSWMAVWRVLQCNPFSKGGVDEVPPERTGKPKLAP